jgi:primosomal replication protein N
LARRQPEAKDEAAPLDAQCIGPNRVQLGGQVAAREPLRYSPAGVPIVAVHLLHNSWQKEGGAPRQAAVEIELLAIGEVAIKLDAVLPGRRITATGFLANRSRRSRRVVLHVNEFEID